MWTVSDQSVSRTGNWTHDLAWVKHPFVIEAVMVIEGERLIPPLLPYETHVYTVMHVGSYISQILPIILRPPTLVRACPQPFTPEYATPSKYPVSALLRLAHL